MYCHLMKYFCGQSVRRLDSFQNSYFTRFSTPGVENFLEMLQPQVLLSTWNQGLKYRPNAWEEIISLFK